MDDQYIKRIHALPNYVASSQLYPLIQWKPEHGGHTLISKETQETFIGVAVVNVYDNKLDCGPNGNFIKPDVGSLKNAKYQLQAGRPADSAFGPDFPKMYSLFQKLQEDIASTAIHSDLLIPDPSAKIICFASNVFEKRETPVTVPSTEVYLEDVMDTGTGSHHRSEDHELEMIDDETLNWPMPPGKEFARAFHEIIPFYRALPLRVFKQNNVFVEPQDVINALRDATIEIQFTLHHVHLHNQNPPRDSFRADIEQIVILKAGKVRNAALRSSNPRSGPIMPEATMNMKRHLPEAESSASGSTEKKKSRKNEEGPSGSNFASKGKGKAVDESEIVTP